MMSTTARVIASVIAGVSASAITPVAQTIPVVGTAETLPQLLGHSLLAGVFAAGGAWALLRERVNANRKLHDEQVDLVSKRFTSVSMKLDAHETLLREMSQSIGELVGEARARRRVHRAERDA